jgi:uncharacterized protein HemX
MSDESSVGKILSIILIVLIVGAVTGLAYFYPQYKVYSKEMEGKADLAEAEWSKKIQIEEAKGMLEAAKYNRETELIQANTEAEANRIVAGSLDEMYIKYKMVEKMTDSETQVIYIPTEAGIPIIEAKRTATAAAGA